MSYDTSPSSPTSVYFPYSPADSAQMSPNGDWYITGRRYSNDLHLIRGSPLEQLDPDEALLATHRGRHIASSETSPQFPQSPDQLDWTREIINRQNSRSPDYFSLVTRTSSPNIHRFTWDAPQSPYSPLNSSDIEELLARARTGWYSDDEEFEFEERSPIPLTSPRHAPSSTAPVIPPAPSYPILPLYTESAAKDEVSCRFLAQQSVPAIKAFTTRVASSLEDLLETMKSTFSLEPENTMEEIMDGVLSHLGVEAEENLIAESLAVLAKPFVATIREAPPEFARTQHYLYATDDQMLWWQLILEDEGGQPADISTSGHGDANSGSLEGLNMPSLRLRTITGEQKALEEAAFPSTQLSKVGADFEEEWYEE